MFFIFQEVKGYIDPADAKMVELRKTFPIPIINDSGDPGHGPWIEGP